MTANDWALAVVMVAFFGFLVYGITRYLDEIDTSRATRRRLRDDAYWRDLMHTVQRARWDFNR